MKEFWLFCRRVMFYNGHTDPRTKVCADITLEADAMLLSPVVIFIAHRLRATLLCYRGASLAKQIILAVWYTVWNIGAAIAVNLGLLYYMYSRKKYKVEILDRNMDDPGKARRDARLRFAKLAFFALLWALFELLVLLYGEVAFLRGTALAIYGYID